MSRRNYLRQASGVVILTILALFLALLSSVWAQPVQYSDKVDVIFVIDESGSMRYNDPNYFRKEAAKVFVDLESVPGDKIAVIGFDDKARTYRALNEITTSESKREVHDAINQITTRNGWTDFNEGLQAALAEYRARHRKDTLGGVILLTDGNMELDPENPVNPIYGNNVDLAKKRLYENLLPQFSDIGCPIYTIALTKDADVELLRRVANETGGEFFSVPESKDLPGIYAKIFTRLKESKMLFTDFRETDLKPGEAKEVTVELSKEVREAIFLVTKNDPAIAVSLISPQSKRISQSQADGRTVFYAGSSTYEIYTVKNPSPGKWKIYYDTSRLNSPASAASNVIVYTNLEVKLLSIRQNYNLGAKVLISAELRSPQGKVVDERLLRGMGMRVQVLKPDSSRSKLKLYDDGKHGDKKAGDKIFSNYYTPGEQVGDYKLIVIAEGSIFYKTTTRKFKVEVGAPIKVLNKELDFGTLQSGAIVTKKLTIVSTHPSEQAFSIRLKDIEPKKGGASVSLKPDAILVSGKGRTYISISLSTLKGAPSGTYTGLIVLDPQNKAAGIKPISILFSVHIPSWWDFWRWPLLITLLVLVFAGGTLYYTKDTIRRLPIFLTFPKSAYLTIVKEDGTDYEEPLKGKQVLVGTTPKCDIALPMKEGEIIEILLKPVSQKRNIEVEMLRLKGAEFVVDGELVGERTILYDGSRINIGGLELRVQNGLSSKRTLGF